MLYDVKQDATTGGTLDLRNALGQIADIRQQIARAQTFRGYRAATTGFTGLVAIAAAALQAYSIPEPRQQLNDYLMLWLLAAALNIAAVGAELAVRCWRSDRP